MKEKEVILIDDTDLEKNEFDDECNICLEPVLPHELVGYIGSCCPQKQYHKNCILQWSKNSNSCPQCRRRFNNVTIASKDKVIETISIKDKLLPNPAVEEIPREFIVGYNEVEETTPEVSYGVCSICSSSDYRAATRNMINCNECGSNFHLMCLGLTGEEALVDWWCPFCDSCQQLALPSTGGNVRSGGRGRGRSRASAIGRARPSAIGRRASPVPTARRVRLIDHTAAGHVAGAPTTRPGLVIHNNNNELDDSFLYQEDLDEDALPVHNVINGGVLLRKELRARKNLSPEEKQSWDGFEKLRQGVVEDNSKVVETLNENQELKKRRRRKRITPIETKEIKQDQEGSSRNPSRISNLINQLKTSNKSAQPQFPAPQNINISESPSSLSPSSNSLQEYSGESDTQYDSDCKIIKKPRPELTLDHKIQIQKYIRNNLRPLYKIDQNSSPRIHTEDEYIRINKATSHKIYQHLLNGSISDPNFIDKIFEEPNHTNLQHIVDQYVQEELRGKELAITK